jgi:hypothetical protein
MKILSIDVGIKNLAFCLFIKEHDSHEFAIKKWDVVNISEQETVKCSFIEKNIICNKPAKYKKNNKCYCLKHSKKQEYQIPTSQQKPSFINKQKLEKLMEIADNHGIVYANKIKKTNLISLINQYMEQKYFQEIEIKNASEINLCEIGKNIQYNFNKIFLTEENIDYVIIENQISPIATRMKTIQGMIVQYFIMSSIHVNQIEFISSVNKLKLLSNNDKTTNPIKTTYSERKQMSISKCLEIITNQTYFHPFIEFFNKHNKKDDLSDSFLQGLWFIQNKKL